MSKFFSFSQSEAKRFLENSKTLAKIVGLKLVGERSKKPDEAQKSPELHAEFVPANLAPTVDTPLEHGKLLIVIPRRVANACGRNLIRRRIKAICIEHQLLKKPKRHALFVYPEAKKLSYDQLAEFLEKSL